MKTLEMHISSDDTTVTNSTTGTTYTSTSTPPPYVQASEVKEDVSSTSHPAPVLLSTVDKCTVSADTRGALGPPEIILTKGDDWNKDRWAVPCKNDWNAKQAAIPNWIQLDWDEPVLICRVALDWETAYSDKYDLEIRTSALAPWKIVFQSTDPNAAMERRQWGKPPTKSTRCLHYEHDIDLSFMSTLAVSLRVFVHDSAKRNGYLSLWHIQVVGYDSFPTRPMILTELTNTSLYSAENALTVSASNAGDDNHLTENVLNSSTSCWHVLPGNVLGGLWVCLTFPTPVLVTKVVLDWSAGYSMEYKVEVGSECDGWETICSLPCNAKSRLNFSSVEGTGKPPAGEDGSQHQHVTHTHRDPLAHSPTRNMRLLILNPASPRDGITLWQIRVYGYKL